MRFLRSGLWEFLELFECWEWLACFGRSRACIRSFRWSGGLWARLPIWLFCCFCSCLSTLCSGFSCLEILKAVASFLISWVLSWALSKSWLLRIGKICSTPQLRRPAHCQLCISYLGYSLGILYCWTYFWPFCWILSTNKGINKKKPKRKSRRSNWSLKRLWKRKKEDLPRKNQLDQTKRVVLVTPLLLSDYKSQLRTIRRHQRFQSPKIRVYLLITGEAARWKCLREPQPPSLLGRSVKEVISTKDL